MSSRHGQATAAEEAGNPPGCRPRGAVPAPCPLAGAAGNGLPSRHCPACFPCRARGRLQALDVPRLSSSGFLEKLNKHQVFNHGSGKQQETSSAVGRGTNRSGASPAPHPPRRGSPALLRHLQVVRKPRSAFLRQPGLWETSRPSPLFTSLPSSRQGLADPSPRGSEGGSFQPGVCLVCGEPEMAQVEHALPCAGAPTAHPICPRNGAGTEPPAPSARCTRTQRPFPGPPHRITRLFWGPNARGAAPRERFVSGQFHVSLNQWVSTCGSWTPGGLQTTPKGLQKVTAGNQKHANPPTCNSKGSVPPFDVSKGVCK